MKAGAAARTAPVPRPVHPGQPLQTLVQDGIGSLDELKAATMRCRECPIGAFAAGTGRAGADQPRPVAAAA